MKYYFLLACFLNASITFSQEIIGHIITDKGDKIDMYRNAENKVKGRMYHILYGDMNLTGEYVRYYNEKNQLKKFPQKKVEKLVYGSKKYITLPIERKVKRVHEVIAENDGYLLTEYYSYGGFYFYIFNKANMKPEVEKMQHSLFVENDVKILEQINKYFQDCSGLIELMTENMENWDKKTRKTSIGNVTSYLQEKSEKGVDIANRVLSQGIIAYECN